MICLKYCIVILFGTLCGSFFYTLAFRFSQGIFERDGYKALLTPSRCPACSGRIPPCDLIPLIGFCMIKGKCRECGCRISPAYPIFEIAYGLLSLIIAIRLGINIYSLLVFLLMGLSISISIIDTKTLSIPNSLIITFVLLSFYPVILHNSWCDNLFGLLATSSFFIVILLLFPGGFGGGDIKYASAIGLLLGLELSIVAIETSLITGSIAGIIYAVKSKKGFRIQMPFAPFLTVGLLVAFLYGRDIALLYYRLVF